MTDNRPPIVIGLLRTERLVLTPLDPETDAADIHMMYANPEVGAFGDTPPPTGVEQTRGFLRNELKGNGGTTWAIRLDDDPQALGTIGIFGDQGTTIRGIGWSLRRSHWGLGITSEAARAAVPYLLAQGGVDGLEAWVDPLNTRSLAVARNAGMVEGGRLPHTYRTRVGESVVMVRAAVPMIVPVVSVSPVLPVRDVPATIRLFTEVFGLVIGWEIDDPPTRALLAITPWSGSPGLIVEHSEDEIAPVKIAINIAESVDDVTERVAAFGIVPYEGPTDRPWYRRDCSFHLDEGHTIQVVGAVAPIGA